MDKLEALPKTVVETVVLVLPPPPPPLLPPPLDVVKLKFNAVIEPECQAAV